MADEKVYPVQAEFAAKAHVDAAGYDEMYARSIADPEAFWAKQAERFIDWFEPWESIQDCDLGAGRIRWFEGGKLNASYNCLDRHLEKNGDKPAILWETDTPGGGRSISYRELHEEVCRFANALKARGVKKGDRVCVYMPMVPEVLAAVMACTRIGAVHSIVFGGFSPEALKDRILDSDCRVVITADEGLRGSKIIPLKVSTDKALEGCPNVHTLVVIRRTGNRVAWHDDRDCWYHDLVAAASPDCPPEPMEAEDPLFILYTSGSTGKPKGVQHTTGGYLVYAACTFHYIFDHKDDDVFWCGADIGWITGHTYVTYGPFLNGATVVMFEGIPTYPDASRFWEIVDKFNVTVFYTAPTAIRAVMAHGDEAVTRTSRKSLRLLGTVGEPISPEAWGWYHSVVGDGRCPIVDTWWQTETGGILITPLAGAHALKPGAACRPFFGIRPAILDSDGNELEGEAEGALCMTHSWPGQMRTIYGDHERFIETYLSQHPGMYFTGDGARRDADGDYWITGRVDDVINVSGHRLGTAEVESALALHEHVAEAAVVGFPHEIKGQALYAYVTPMQGVEPTDEMMKELIAVVRAEIGPFAAPDFIQWAPGLPKTRSGKIMRRILRCIAADEINDLGDTSTLAEPAVVENLIENRLRVQK